ncbi:hypothetical protein GCM10009682_43540 [Luedemannella flava]|uniref:Uncharacterized protein n=1 Tax=Luedemannella flava TaxID=349316 RepID=A0ABN2MBA6_9ACTN
MQTTLTTRATDRSPAFVVVTAMTPLVLGLMAYAADETSGLARAVLLALFSSGAAWGLAALVIGFLAPGRRLAIIAGVGGLIGATVVYYALIVFVSRRWQGGWLEDGTPADVMGLWSIARALGFWLVVSVVAGAVFGVLGDAVARASDRVGAAAAGVAWGLAAASGIHDLLVLARWVGWNGQATDIAVSAAMTIALATLVVAVLRRRRGPRGSGGMLALAATVSSGVGTAAWWLVESVRTAV